MGVFFKGDYVDKKTLLDINEQILFLKNKGIMFKDVEKEKIKLFKIGYFKFLEYSFDFMKNQKYEKIYFEDILNKYNYDKKLRMACLNVIEEVEVSIKNTISKVFLENFGEYDYLEYKNWIDKKMDKEIVIQKEKWLKNHLEREIKKTNRKIILNYVEKNQTEKLPIYYSMHILTLGATIEMYSFLMLKYKKMVDMKYNLKNNELESYLKIVGFIRNLSAHNANIIDIEINTKPKINREWMKNRIFYLAENKPTNKIALAILILEYLLNNIITNYEKREIRDILIEICSNSNEKSQKLGFLNYEVVKNLKI